MECCHHTSPSIGGWEAILGHALLEAGSNIISLQTEDLGLLGCQGRGYKFIARFLAAGYLGNPGREKRLSDARGHGTAWTKSHDVDMILPAWRYRLASKKTSEEDQCCPTSKFQKGLMLHSPTIAKHTHTHTSRGFCKCPLLTMLQLRGCL